jgi:hypothetical protein
LISRQIAGFVDARPCRFVSGVMSFESVQIYS